MPLGASINYVRTFERSNVVLEMLGYENKLFKIKVEFVFDGGD